MKVLVCGGRNYGKTPKEKSFLYRVLDQVNPTMIIDGGAAGADALAEGWAFKRAIPSKTYPADWHIHGPAAGPMRNQKMLDEGKPDLVIAFPGGRGTADMVARARKAGVEVREVSP